RARDDGAAAREGARAPARGRFRRRLPRVDRARPSGGFRLSSRTQGSRDGRAATAALRVLLAATLLAACGDASGTGGTAADPATPGPYPVGVTRITLRDEARGRTLLTEVWYPADESVRGLPPSPLGEYLPPD